MKTRVIVYADEGKVLTDGENYGRIIFLADDRTADEFHEITDAEYEAILKEQQQKEEINEDIH